MKKPHHEFTFRPSEGPDEEIELLVKDKVCVRCKDKLENIDDLPLWD